MINNEEEIWKALPGVPGVEVSTLGNVRTLDMVVSNGRGTYPIKGRILKQCDTRDGYLQVSIKVDGKQATKKVHRLVAKAFIPNPDNLPQINHKDCNTRNNNVENLEWCTPKYNCQYREKFGKSQGQPVLAVNLTTLEVSHFRSQGEASRVIGVSNSHINDVINGRRKQANGYWFVSNDNNASDTIKQKLHEIKKIGG